MWLPLIAALLMLDATAAVDDAQPKPAITFQTTKALPQLEQCLTNKLAEVGEVVAVKSEETSVTLVLRNIPDGPMTIDVAPPTVTVTSKPASDTLPLIKACV